jgi:hypothetical protein
VPTAPPQKRFSGHSRSRYTFPYALRIRKVSFPSIKQ